MWSTVTLRPTALTIIVICSLEGTLGLIEQGTYGRDSALTGAGKNL